MAGKAVEPKRRTRGPALVEGKAAYPINRDRIIGVAANVFARSGYHSTSITDLCEATGLSRGSLYYYVDGKETLLYEICSKQVVSMNRKARSIIKLETDSESKLRLLAQSLLTNISEHLDDWTVFFREFGYLENERRVEIMKARDTYERFWLVVVKEWLGKSDLPLSPAVVVKGLLGMFNYSYIWFRPDGRLTPIQMADGFVTIFLDGLRQSRATKST